MCLFSAPKPPPPPPLPPLPPPVPTMEDPEVKRQEEIARKAARNRMGLGETVRTTGLGDRSTPTGARKTLLG